MTQSTDHPSEGATDGRRARRERGRRAAIDAMIDLVLEGANPPMADRVAERAGVSQASLFRYFATLDELRSEAIGRYFERFDALIEIPSIGEGSLDDRIARFVTARDSFYAQTAPMARLVRRQAVDVEQLAVTLERVRATFSEQIEQHFAAELERLDGPSRSRRVAVLAALTSFEAWDQLEALGPRRRRAALAESLIALLPTA